MTKPSVLMLTLPTAVPTPDVGVLKNIVGFLAYPLPLEAMLITPIPAESVTRTAVAAAPTPYDVDPTPVIVEEALTIVIVGVTVYPAPGFVSSISLTDCDPNTEVVIATAVALTPPAGAVDIDTVGVFE